MLSPQPEHTNTLGGSGALGQRGSQGFFKQTSQMGITSDLTHILVIKFSEYSIDKLR
jgi:hypothetical protein